MARKRLFTIILFSCLIFVTRTSFASWIDEDFPSILYNETYSKENADATLQIEVKDESSVTVAIHASLFEGLEALTITLGCDNDAKSIPYRFETKEESSAFKKVIYFLYRKSSRFPIKKDFFEGHDLLELIFLTVEYQIDGLSREIEQFLRNEVNRKLVNPDESILLDRYTSEQLSRLFVKFVNGNKNIFTDPFMQNIHKSLDTYAHFLKVFRKDERFLSYKINPDLYKHICDCLKQTEKLRAENAFKAKTQRIADDIYDKFTQSISTNQGIKCGTFWTDKEFVDPATELLKNRFRNFDVLSYPRLPDWRWGSNLHTLAEERCTPGSCIAQSVGWMVWGLCYLPQIITCDFCIPCASTPAERLRASDGCCCDARWKEDDLVGCTECFCGTQSGAWIAINLYNTVTCCKRPIYIIPKPPQKLDEDLLLPPPAESSMKR